MGMTQHVHISLMTSDDEHFFLIYICVCIYVCIFLMLIRSLGLPSATFSVENADRFSFNRQGLDQALGCMCLTNIIHAFKIQKH